MNAKVLILLAAVLALLVAGYCLVGGRPMPKGGAEGPLKADEKLFPDFKTADARAVTLKKGDRSLRLEKDAAGNWILASHQKRPAASDNVTRLLDAVRDVAFSQTRLGTLEKYDLDDAHRLDLEVFGADDHSLAKLAVGKPVPDTWGKGFVLDPKANDILEVNQDLQDRSQVTTENDRKVLSVDKWYDLKVLQFDENNVIDVAIKKDHETWRIQKVIPGQGPVQPTPKKEEAKKEEPKKEEAKKEEPKQEEPKKEETKKEEPKKEEPKKEEPKPVWWVTEPVGAEADDSPCSTICSTAARLTAKGYADEFKPEDRGLDKPTAKTRLVLKDGAAYTLVFGKVVDDAKDTSKSYVVMQVEGKPEVWKIEKYNYESLTKPVDKLKKEEKKDETKAGEKKEEPAKKDEPAKKEEPPIPPIPDKVKDEPKATPPTAIEKAVDALKNPETPKLEEPKKAEPAKK